MAPINKVENIAIWTLPRSGSSSLMFGIRDSMKATLPQNMRVHHLWEGTGIWGILKFTENKSLWNQIDFSSVDESSTIELHYRQWTVGPAGTLKINQVIGDPRLEVENRNRILREGKWNNAVVFKNMRWSGESYDRVRLSREFDQALLGSPKNFHHVILWRRNILDWLCSRYLLMKVTSPHGVHEWDGVPMGNPEKFKKKRHVRNAMRVVSEFVDSLSAIPKQKSIMIETKAINSLTELVWPTNHRLQLNVDAFKQNAGSVTYINKNTGQKVNTVDLVPTEVLEVFHEINDRIQRTHNWNELPERHGFKSYG